MRTVIFALVGLVVLAGVGATTVALWPSADTEPIESILVDAPRQPPPVPPAPPQALPTGTPVAPPVSAPPPVDVRGVPAPPPAVSGGGAGWQSDDGDDGDDGDWDDDDGDDD